MQLGFGVAALIDPATKAQVPLLGTLLYMAAVIGFFAIDGHHLVLRALSYSLQHLPPGTPYSAINIGAAVDTIRCDVLLAVAISAPVIFLLLLVDAALAVMARSMPQMNVFFLSLPLKILVGLLALVLVDRISRRRSPSEYSNRCSIFRASHWLGRLGRRDAEEDKDKSERQHRSSSKKLASAVRWRECRFHIDLCDRALVAGINAWSDNLVQSGARLGSRLLDSAPQMLEVSGATSFGCHHC